MKKYFSFCLAISIILTLFGCGSSQPKEPVTLYICRTYWNGFEPDVIPTRKYTAIENIQVRETYALGEVYGEEFSIKIKRVNTDRIVIKTSMVMSTMGENGGFNLMSDETQFTVTNGKELKIVTPSTDGGTIFIFSFEPFEPIDSSQTAKTSDETIPDSNVMLYVCQTYWTGWLPEHIPTRVYKTIPNIQVGKTYVPGQIYDEDFTIKIKAISDNTIEIETNRVMSTVGENGGINLYSDETQFTVTKGKELELVTPTMDGGDIFIFSFDPIEPVASSSAEQ
jgi:hypothetical protein